MLCLLLEIKLINLSSLKWLILKMERMTDEESNYLHIEGGHKYLDGCLTNFMDVP